MTAMDLAKQKWAPFQYPIRRFIVRYLKDSKPRHLHLKSYDHTDMCQASRLPRCLSKFKAMRYFKLLILRLGGFRRSYDKTSNRILKRALIIIIIIIRGLLRYFLNSYRKISLIRNTPIVHRISGHQELCNTMGSRYIAVIFRWRFRERQTIARPWGWDIGCRSQMHCMAEIVSLWLLFCLYYRVIDNHNISWVNSNMSHHILKLMKMAPTYDLYDLNGFMFNRWWRRLAGCLYVSTYVRYTARVV